MSFVHVPAGRFDKAQHFEKAKEISGNFLKLNDISVPPMINRADIGSKGWYDRGKILVDISKTIVPVKAPGYSWSFPGYKADVTVYGVTAHETGHHVSAIRRFARKSWRKGHSDPAVTGYGRANDEEGLAEAIRVFILNPELLREGRPGMFRVLTQDFSLRPLHDDPWEVVLMFAHDKIIAAAEKWIERRLK